MDNNRPPGAVHQVMLTANEKKIIKWFREANPFEQLTIKKDNNGNIDKGWIERSQKFKME